MARHKTYHICLRFIDILHIPLLLFHQDINQISSSKYIGDDLISDILWNMNEASKKVLIKLIKGKLTG